MRFYIKCILIIKHNLTKLTGFFQSQVLCTAGESGYISVWKPGEPSEKCTSGLKKMSKSRNKHKAKPY